MFFSNSAEADEKFDDAISRSFNRSPSIEASMWASLSVDRGLPVITLESQRITRVAAKIVRGLEYLRSGESVPLAATFRYRLYEPPNVPDMLKSVLSSSIVDNSDAPNFRCRFVENPSVDCNVLWELTFYDAFSVAVGIVSKIDDKANVHSP
jgi:hypothetical protein